VPLRTGVPSRRRERSGAAVRQRRAGENRRILEPGDSVTYTIAPPVVLEVLEQDLPLDVVFEDETLLVVNKAAGMVTHPSHGLVDNTLVTRCSPIRARCPASRFARGSSTGSTRPLRVYCSYCQKRKRRWDPGRAMQKRYIKREYRASWPEFRATRRRQSAARSDAIRTTA